MCQTYSKPIDKIDTVAEKDKSLQRRDEIAAVLAVPILALLHL
jgi:hypothetical protein